MMYGLMVSVQPSKLSDVVYTTLQIIARTREKGIAIKDLGPITGYDPKSIFYQIQQLVALNLMYVIMFILPFIYWFDTRMNRQSQAFPSSERKLGNPPAILRSQ